MITLSAKMSAPQRDALQQTVWPVMTGLVHDLRQPLSVIDACADYLDLVLPADDQGARRQLQLLQQQVREANRIMHEALLDLHYDGARSESSVTNAASAAVTY